MRTNFCPGCPTALTPTWARAGATSRAGRSSASASRGLKHPKVLILDDSTSAVDTATESGIRHALAGLGSVTKLIIAQRITSVQSADLIVILDDGRLHAVGTHDELLAKDTIYQEIYHSQMKGGDADGEAIRR